jgi:hypothetical protein
VIAVSRAKSSIERRIDRLSRGAHAFHRFAHHPLCDDYAGEVLRFGRRVRLCRGCTLAFAGAVAGCLLALVSVPGLLVAGSALAAALLLAIAPLRDAGKLATRFWPALLLAFAITAGALGASPAGVGLSLLGLGAGSFAVVRYRRRGPDRSPCSACPERSRAEPCRGFVEIVRRERAFGRLSGSWLQKSSAAPRPPWS